MQTRQAAQIKCVLLSLKHMHQKRNIPNVGVEDIFFVAFQGRQMSIAFKFYIRISLQ